MDNVQEDLYKDATLIMQLLHDNLTLWTPQALAPADVVVVGVEKKQQEERAIMMVDVPQGAEEVANKLFAAAKSKKRRKGGLAAPMEL